jgi:hypothetical protein
MHAAMCDIDREQKSIIHSLKKQVGKVASLLANRRGMQAESTTTNAALSRAGSKRVGRLQADIWVRFVIILFACYLC